MSDNKANEKANMEEVMKALAEARNKQVTYTIQKHIHPGGSNIMPTFTVTVSGGRVEKLDELMVDIGRMVLDYQQQEMEQ
jgi:hypothetical protein